MRVEAVAYASAHMTLEELADLLRTPLPGPPRFTDAQMESVRSAGGRLAGLLPDMSASRLPMAPEWMQRYALQRGLIPDEVRSGLTPESRIQPRFAPGAPLLTPEQIEQ